MMITLVTMLRRIKTTLVTAIVTVMQKPAAVNLTPRQRVLTSSLTWITTDQKLIYAEELLIFSKVVSERKKKRRLSSWHLF